MTVRWTAGSADGGAGHLSAPEAAGAADRGGGVGRPDRRGRAVPAADPLSVSDLGQLPLLLHTRPHHRAAAADLQHGHTVGETRPPPPANAASDHKGAGV